MADTIVAAKSPLYAGRRRRNAIYKTLAWIATGFGLGWLVLILGILLFHGIGGDGFAAHGVTRSGARCASACSAPPPAR